MNHNTTEGYAETEAQCKKAGFCNMFFRWLKSGKHLLFLGMCIVISGLLLPACENNNDEAEYRYYLDVNFVGSGSGLDEGVFSVLMDWIDERVSYTNTEFSTKYGVWKILGKGETVEERVSNADEKAIEMFKGESSNISSIMTKFESDFIALRKEMAEQIKNSETDSYIALTVRCQLIKEENGDYPVVATSIETIDITLFAYPGEDYE